METGREASRRGGLTRVAEVEKPENFAGKTPRTDPSRLPLAGSQGKVVPRAYFHLRARATTHKDLKKEHSLKAVPGNRAPLLVRSSPSNVRVNRSAERFTESTATAGALKCAATKSKAKEPVG
jgi:hypothetical protein